MKRILIAEGNEPSRELVREILETEGYDVIEASDGQEALEMILASNPDLIVMNIQMPWTGRLQSSEAGAAGRALPTALMAFRRHGGNLGRG
jgi:CheY-like chemotaxis protein